MSMCVCFPCRAFPHLQMEYECPFACVSQEKETHKKTVMADEASASLSDNAVRGFLEQPKTYSVRGFDHAAADLFGDCAVGNGQDTRT
jgi:hypothetical protein